MSTNPVSCIQLAVAGNPVAHSRSPFIHAAFAQQFGLPVHYQRLLCSLDGFEPELLAFAASARGCNVTVPFKERAFAMVQRGSARAQLAQAVNTLRFDGPQPSQWWGDNTDGVGLVADIQNHAGLALAGTRVLLIGAGGAAAGALGPLLACRPRSLWVANRSPEKAHRLALRHLDWAQAHGADLQTSGLNEVQGRFDVVINATASSLQSAAIPVPIEVLRPGSLALDMMYGPAAQGFLGWAAQAGAHGRDGLGMLVEQAAEAWSVWFGDKPATAPVLRELRQALASPSAAPGTQPGHEAAHG
jgi:shikimate dehydrogenase